MKTVLNLDNYPNLKKMAVGDHVKFQHFLKSVMEFADKATKENRPKQAEDSFNMDYMDLIAELSGAFFDYEGITSHHHNEKEARMLNVLKLENNPLASNNFYRIVDGKPISKDEFFGGEKSIKEWLQSMLYAGRYLSHADLVRYLTLGEYDLVERMKTDRIQELLKIQPALAYQSKNDLIVGKYLEGTGFFFCGEYHKKEPICPSCSTNHKFYEYKNYMMCHHCLGAFITKEDNNE